MRVKGGMSAAGARKTDGEVPRIVVFGVVKEIVHRWSAFF
jgi:hypothetical protein